MKSCQSRIYGASFYYLRNAADAQEATQEVFIKVYNSQQGYTGQAAGFLPWLLTITRNCCLDRLRSAKLRSQYEDAYEMEQTFADLESETPDAIDTRERRRRLLYRVLEDCSETSHDVLLLKDIQGLKLEQVAEILSLPVGTLKSRSNRARIELAQRMAELVDEIPKSSGMN